MTQDLNDLYYFAQVVDHRGFAAAGRALGIPKSKLSRRIAQLEERLGARLIQRSTRSLSVTELGQSYYEHCKAMLVEAEAAQESIERNRAEPQGTVRLTCPVALLHGRVGVMLADFLMEHPRVTLQVESTNRRVDVINEGVDVALRVRLPPLEDSDLVLKTFGVRHWCLTASPALLEKCRVPEVPADLHRFPSLSMTIPAEDHVWYLENSDGETASIRYTPRMMTDDTTALKRAAVAGAGIVFLPTMVVIDELRNGSLVKVLPEWAPKSGIIHAVYSSRRFLLPSVRQLIDFLAQRFEALEDY
ncbi:transcriptional regulator [Herbaspirillum sp. CF444]|uniref:LysR family transcriptional regulator n=1 Tax=Herbaspirillum sp. CF444 TaxID=1144319 RepID=UPI00027257BA|nr:LysR family transcriptional regulator [Herbaspirillum sp. CF444]EJL89154.1 transcriptional regulator [Herbaspirillum sp. CF444]